MWITAYQTMRTLKWLLWIGFVGFSLHYILNRVPYVDQFGQLTISAEAIMFGLPLGAVVAGLLELSFRERAYPPRLP